jgi:nicotinamide riboside kinase
MSFKVAIVGPESTGKTTVFQYLQSYYKCTTINDYSRKYLTENGLKYDEKDVLTMATNHSKLIRDSSDYELTILDTDLLNYVIWFEVKYIKFDDSLLKLWRDNKADLYFLLLPTLSWEYDEMRESEFTQDLLVDLHIKYLNENNCFYYIIDSCCKKRLNYIVFLINHALHLHHC